MYFSSWCTADVYTMTVCSRGEQSDRSVYFTLFLIVIGSEQIHSLSCFGLVRYSLLGKMPSYLWLVSKLTILEIFISWDWNIILKPKWWVENVLFHGLKRFSTLPLGTIWLWNFQKYSCFVKIRNLTQALERWFVSSNYYLHLFMMPLLNLILLQNLNETGRNGKWSSQLVTL